MEREGFGGRGMTGGRGERERRVIKGRRERSMREGES